MAAQFSFQAPATEVGLDKIWTAELRVDTQEQYINALQGKISYPTDKLAVTDIKDNGSIINFWVERPRAQAGEISFSGIIPGGYLGQGPLFTVYFKTRTRGLATLIQKEGQALLNDGQGTATPVELASYNLNISVQAPEQNVIAVETRDTEAPEKFDPLITRSQDLAGNKYVLIFYAQDKGSGIDHYEIKEGLWGFKRATSPYVLARQKLDHTILVKAVDRYGNFTIAKVSPVEPAVWYEKLPIFAIIYIIVGVIILLMIRVLWRKIKTKRK